MECVYRYCICRTQVEHVYCGSLQQRRTSFFPRLLCWSRSATCSRCWTATTFEVRFSTEEINEGNDLQSFTGFGMCCTLVFVSYVSDVDRCSRTRHQAAAPITDSRQTTGIWLSPFVECFICFLLTPLCLS